MNKIITISLLCSAVFISAQVSFAAKANAAFNGKFSPDIDDVKAVAIGILRHRIIKNYKADAEGISEEMIVAKLI